VPALDLLFSGARTIRCSISHPCSLAVNNNLEMPDALGVWNVRML
jgi:LSD1 subclass zinc finger protein